MQNSVNRVLRFATFCSTLTLVVGAISVATPVAAYAQAVEANDIEVMGRRPVADQFEGVVIDDVINIIGFDQLKANSSGELKFTGQDVVFISDKAQGSISLNSINAFAIEHSTKALLRGFKGTLASLAPNGAGQIYSAIRPGSETLTLFYTDENQALHGAVVLIPKNRKEDVLRAFERVGLTPSEFSGESGADAEPLDVRGTPVNRSLPHIGRPSVILALPQSDAQSFPAAFKAGIYEELVAQTMKSGFFDRVWRQGDDRAGVDALTLNLDITEFKKGNAGVRGAIPVVGMLAGKTLIRADLRLADASGAVLLDKEVKGSKRMMGESIAATKSLAQRVASSLADVPGLKKGEPSVEMASN